MRLWHQRLIPHLCLQHTLGQHKELCMMRGGGWGADRDDLNWIWKREIEVLIAFHLYAMKWGRDVYDIDYSNEWKIYNYRGKGIGYDSGVNTAIVSALYTEVTMNNRSLYHEQDYSFLKRDVKDLRERSESDESNCDCYLSNRG